MKEMQKQPPAHGGDWAGFEIEYGREALDFSMNVNPLGMPGDVAKAIACAAPRADRYPDPECRRLRSALAGAEGLPAEWILCGNGAADLIDRIALGLRGRPADGAGESRPRALVTAPTFAEYEEALARCGWAVEHLPLNREEGFHLRTLPSVLSGAGHWAGGLLFLCEPNNPTGVTTDRGLLLDILKACRDRGMRLVVDECFGGFLDDPEAHTVKPFLGDYPNLIILKAFTKLYGMAGVRLGYCLCSDGETLDRIRAAGQPWSVSYLAEEAGIAALKQEGWVEGTREMISGERDFLRRELAGLGVEEIFGEANYLLLRWPGREDFSEALRTRGILIRDCSNYHGLEKGWYRIAVRTREENRRLIEALKALGSE